LWPVDHVKGNTVSCEAMKEIRDPRTRPAPVGAHGYDVRFPQPRTNLGVLQHAQVVELASQALGGGDVNQYGIATCDEAGQRIRIERLPPLTSRRSKDRSSRGKTEKQGQDDEAGGDQSGSARCEGGNLAFDRRTDQSPIAEQASRAAVTTAVHPPAVLHST